MGFSRLINTGVRVPPPGRLCPSSFLLLFTTLWLHGERLVQARRSVVHVFIVKHNGFEHSNGPIPPVAQIRPGTPNGPPMLHILMAPSDQYYEYYKYYTYFKYYEYYEYYKYYKYYEYCVRFAMPAGLL